jgi:uncharacterized protein (DUF305 family)
MQSKSVIAFLALALAAAISGCGGGESEGASGAAKPTPEQGFLQGMVPHHTSAVEIAKVAKEEGESDFVRGLAEEITSSQTAEIEQMRRIHQRLFKAPLEPDMNGHMPLGLSAEEAGMNHMDSATTLRGKKPFDRAFVDEMVPHHQGAIRMAEAVLTKSQDSELRELAEEIVSAQEREIEEMNAFREREYGGPVPSSSTPAGDHPMPHGG